MRTGKVTKKKAEELAKQLLGTGKLMKEDEYGYYFQSGQIKIRVSPWNTKGNKKVFQTFFLAGKWYEGEVLEVFIWVGDYYNPCEAVPHDRICPPAPSGYGKQ